MIKPKTIYKWIQKRYEYYDKKENKYCGEKYTPQVLEDAEKHFKLPLEQINELYNQGALLINKENYEKKKVNSKTKEEMRKFIQNIKLDKFKVTKLHNKKVKINIDSILKDEKRDNAKFLEFIKANKDVVFTAITDKKMNVCYTFKEDNTWLFHEDDLIEVKEN